MQRAVALAVCAFALLLSAAAVVVRAAEAGTAAEAELSARVAHILRTSRVPHHVSDELMYTVLYDADARDGAQNTFTADEVVSRFMDLQLHRCAADANHWFSLSTMHEGEKRGRDGCGECAVLTAHAHSAPAALSFLETTRAANGAESEADAAHGLVSAVQRGCAQLLAAPCCANAPEAQGGDLLLEAQAHLERVLPEQLQGASLLEATSEYWTHRRAKTLPKHLRFGVAAEDDTEDAAADEQADDAASEEEDAEDVETVLLATSERVELTSRAALRAAMRTQRANLLNGVSARNPLHELDFVDAIVRALDEQMSRPDTAFDTTLIGRLLNTASGAHRIRVPTPADNVPAPKHFDLIAASTDVRDNERAFNAAEEAADIAAEEAHPWQPKRKSRAVRNVRKEHQRKAKLLRRLVHKRDGPVPTPQNPAKGAKGGAGTGTVKPAADFDNGEVSRLVKRPAPKPVTKPAEEEADADAEGDTDAPAGFAAAPKPAVAGSAKVNAAHAAVSTSKAAAATEATAAAGGATAAVKTNVALKLIKRVKTTATKAKAKAKTAAKKSSKAKKTKAKAKGKKKTTKKKGAAAAKKKPAAKKDESVWDKIEHGVEDAAKAVKGAAEKAVKAVKKAVADVANSDVVKSLKILFGASAVPDLNTPAMAAWKKQHLKRLDNRMKAPVGDKWAPNANRPFHGHAKCDPVSGTAAAAQRIVGVAESHGHMFSALSFGGDYIHGGFNGTTAEALKPCNGQFTQHGAGLGSEAFHQYRTKYNGGWPRWDSTSHQQMHVSWLKNAATRKDQFALKTIFLTAVHNDLICLLYKIMGRIPAAFLKEWERAGYRADDVCDDVPNYERQMRAAHELAAEQSEWMGLAKTPAECRDLIAQGKLCAIQAGGEVGDMCGRDEAPEACVDRIYSKGARVFQLCHLRNNRFSGIGMHTEYINTAGTILEILRDYKASGHNPSAEVKSKTGLLKVLAVVKDAWNRLSNTVKAIGKELSAYPWRHEKHNLVGAPNTDIKYNPKGLSPLGVRLVERAIALKMPIDVSHASRETVRGVYELAKKHNYFPFFSSHANIMETEDAEHATEYNIEFEEMQRVLEVGGFVGMRPNPNTYPMYVKAKHRTTCQGSSSAFAQNTEFLARELALPVTFATDFNGAATNLHPRFYNKKADTHKIWTFESCRGERSCLNNAVSPLDWFMDASAGEAITNTIGNLKAVFSKAARDEQLDKSGKCAKELTEILAEQQFQTTNAITKVRADPTAIFDTTGLGRVDGLSHAAKDMAHLGASMTCPVCMLSGAENAIRTWERAFLPGDKRQRMPVKSFLVPEPGNPNGPKALMDTLSYTFDGPFKGPYTTDEQYVAGAPDNCLPQIAHDA